LKKLQYILLLTFIYFSFSVQAQELDELEVGLIYKREQSMGFNLNTDGWGMDYRIGFFKTGYLKRTIDISFSFIRDPKETRFYNNYEQSYNSFVFGKERNFYSFRVLYGKQKDLANKPYWGGVEIRWLNLWGLNFGIGKPIYLYVADQLNEGVVDLQRYDPTKHNLSNIFGRGPYSKGLNELEWFPGISYKTALNVEYGTIADKTRAIEAGVVFNVYLRPYNIMAYSDARYFDISVYVSFHFGKRFNR